MHQGEPHKRGKGYGRAKPQEQEPHKKGPLQRKENQQPYFRISKSFHTFYYVLPFAFHNPQYILYS